MNRVLDIAVALLALVLLSPLLLAIALVVLAASGRPVLFRQVRVGRAGVPFTLLKFRSMRCGSSGSAITAAGDARITGIGRVLRRYKLDELPQLLNILRGEMSFIGPRPEVPLYVDPQCRSWQQVLAVRPGLTDLATLLYRDEEQLLASAPDRESYYRDVVLPEKLSLNLHYLRTRSLFSDLRLLGLTAASSLYPGMFRPAMIRRAFAVPAVAFLLFFAVSPAVTKEYYVAPSGKASAAGTRDDPWNLARGLSGARPGDTVWLRGGLYTGSYSCTASGKPGQPIIIRQFPGESARIDGGTTINATILIECSYVWFWGFELFSSSVRRVSAETGPNPLDLPRPTPIATYQEANAGKGVRLINLVIRDGWNGIGFWKEAEDSEIYGNIIFHNGWKAPDRGHGHGIYAQNADGLRRIEENIIFGNFSHGLHIYSTGDLMQNFHIEGNVAFNNGGPGGSYARNYLIGAGASRSVPRNVVFRENFSWYSPPSAGGASAMLGSSPLLAEGCRNLKVNENWFVAESGVSLDKPPECSSIELQGNHFIGSVRGFEPRQYPDNSYSPGRPSGLRVFVRPNRYEPGRAHIIIYNWERRSAVAVDPRNVLAPGDPYEVRDAQNYLGAPVLTGTYESGPLMLPMTGTAVSAIAGQAPHAPAHTGPEFGVFVLRRLARKPPVPAGGIRSAAAFREGPVAPGALVTLFGRHLADGTFSAATTPLPVALAGTTVRIAGLLAPLHYVSPEQINAQVPYGSEPGSHTATVETDGASASIGVEIRSVSPSIFVTEGGRAILQDLSGSVAGIPERPASSGSALTGYCTGQGETEGQTETGTPSSSTPLPAARSPAAVFVGGEPARVLYFGLTPGLVGVCQFNFVLPELPDGDHHVELQAGGEISNRAIVSVRNK